MEDSKKTATKKAKPQSQSQTTKMVRDGKTADVHKLEVQNYAKYGWVIK
jgi:hypothetical protein|tara:strand:- start:62 stop:208 length:147 start_codon:yes stop_codon:yes gene_type:complete